MAFSALQSFSATLTANVAMTVTFGDNTVNVPIRYAYVAVTNTSASAVIYARSDGVAATIGGDLCIAVEFNQTLVLANMLPWWSQAANVIPKGTLLGTGPQTGTPFEIGTPYGSSLYGQKASPGTSVSLISSGTTPTFTVSGTG